MPTNDRYNFKSNGAGGSARWEKLLIPDTYVGTPGIPAKDPVLGDADFWEIMLPVSLQGFLSH